VARFPAGTRHFSLLHSAQTGSGNYPLSYVIGIGGGALPPRVNRPGCEAEHSPPSNMFAPPYVLMAWC
jgi:hypothetical protein